MGIVIRLGLAVLLGVGIGAATALWSIGALGGSSSGYRISVDGWTGDTAIGSTASDPYTRARIARRGLMALARDEAIYFFRDRDDAGRRLRAACTYRLSGSPLPARWWSVTLYAADDYLARNDDGAHSVSASSPGMNDGSWDATIGPSRAEGPWLSTAEAGAFSLTLRLYNPSDALRQSPDTFDFPRVERIGCEGGDNDAA